MPWPCVRLSVRPSVRSSQVGYTTNEPQKVTLKLLVTDVIATLGTEPARLHVLQVGGNYSLSNG